VMIDSLATCNSLCHHNILDIVENSRHVLEFRKTHKISLFILGELGDIDCCFVPVSCVNIEIASQVITEVNKFGSFWVCCKRSEQISFRSFVCSADSIYGIFFALTMFVFIIMYYFHYLYIIFIISFIY